MKRQPEKNSRSHPCLTCCGEHRPTSPMRRCQRPDCQKRPEKKTGLSNRRRDRARDTKADRKARVRNHETLAPHIGIVSRGNRTRRVPAFATASSAAARPAVSADARAGAHDILRNTLAESTSGRSPSPPVGERWRPFLKSQQIHLFCSSHPFQASSPSFLRLRYIVASSIPSTLAASATLEVRSSTLRK